MSKEAIFHYVRRALGTVYRLAIMPFNVIWYYVFHRKCVRAPNQRAFWEGRTESDYIKVKASEGDPYYNGLDNFLLSRLKEFRANTYLEIGCYFGYRLDKFSKNVLNGNFIGLDLGLDNLLFGKRRVVDANSVCLVNANAASLPFKRGSIDTVYTVVSLTHMDYSLIHLVIDEIARVNPKNVLLTEIDHRPMSLRRKIGLLNIDYIYLHPYEKLLGNKMDLVAITPIRDHDKHPRYTVFEFSRKGSDR